ncbi:MAG: response regulator transcription factor [Nocardioides sp.]
MIRVGAVDDHPALLRGVQAALREEAADVELVAFATTVNELLAETDEFDLILLDLRLRDDSRPGSNVLRLKKLGIPVLIYTEGSSQDAVEESLAAGADGVLRKDRPLAVLVEAIRSLTTVGSYESVEVARALDAIAELGPHLSPREQETLTLYAAGLPMKAVARRMGVGIETAREYLKRVKAKYAASDRAAYTRMDLFFRAVEDGYVEVNGPTPQLPRAGAHGAVGPDVRGSG